MPLGVGSALWAYVAPLAETNMALNPSFEQGTSGVVAIQTATLGSTSQFQRYGAWSAKITPSSNGTSGALLGTFTTGNGTAYSVSVWAFVEQGVPMRFGVGDNNGLNLTSGTVTFTGGGTWHWYTCAITEAAQGTRGVVLQKTSGNSQLSFYADGLKISPWADALERTTTYFDGDTGGGTWQSTPHASISTRPAQYRAGGSIIALADIGLSVDQFPGAGMPPIEVSTQSYAVVDGAEFQRQRAAARQFTLTASPLYGTSLGDFHITRRTLIDAFKPDAVTPQQPVRFLYVGGQGTQQIDAYYQGGLELGNMDGPIAEQVAIQFVATDPYWYSPTQQGTTLSPRVALGSVNYIARRSPQGQWGTMGVNGSTVINAAAGVTAVWALLENPSGTLFLGGNWGTLAGTLAPGVGMYNPITNRFGTLVGGTVSAAGQLTSLALNPNGTLFMGGNFTSVAGTAANAIARWAGAFGTLQGGTVSAAGGLIYSLLYSPNGTLFFGGQFSNIQGTANSANIGMWTGAFGSLGGTIGVGGGVGQVRTLAWGLDNRLLIGGGFGLVNGTQGTAIGFWKGLGVFGTMGALADNVFDLVIGQDGRLYEAGDFTNALPGGSALRAAVWNGVQHAALGYGLSGLAFSNVIDPITGNILFGGAFTSAGSVNAPANYAAWNGASWLLPDILFVGAAGFDAGTVYNMAVTQDRSLYIAGNFSGTTHAAALGTVVNTGRAQAYPTLRVRNLGVGTARLYQLVNMTTGDGIYFNYVMQGGESAVLTLQPGQRSFTSSAQGNVFGQILPGSNLATWSLLHGTNYISFFADSGSVEASFFWQPKGWSIDSGTVQ